LLKYNSGILQDKSGKTHAHWVIFNPPKTPEMKNYDVRHIAYHVLVGLYFIWVPVFGVLLFLALHNTLAADSVALTVESLSLSKIFLTWIFLNLLMGSALFAVIQLFQQKNLLNKIIRFSFYAIAVVSVTITLLIVGNR
jgi:hypothetical protein